MNITVDADKVIGTIRKLHGTNGGAPMIYFPDNFTEELVKLDTPSIRLHDTNWDNGNLRLVDIHHIFPVFDADPDDPANYFFAHTDDYIQLCLSTGKTILYRLGICIEQTKKKYFAHPPKDYVKWTRICANIIRHYNHDWANGFHHNIEMWEIWNEADLGEQMWSGTWEDYIRLYVTTSKLLKAEFAEIKVGGPGIVSVHRDDMIESFLSACQNEQAPLDFFSWHSYGDDLPALIAEPFKARQLLDKFGFCRTELNLNEWHYLPGGWDHFEDKHHRSKLYAEMNGPDGAAFNAAVLTGWQDTPLDLSNHFNGAVLPPWGILDVFGIPMKNFYGFLSFSLLGKCDERLAADSYPEQGVWVLAGRLADGGVRVLISCFKAAAGKIDVKINGVNLAEYTVSVNATDSAHDFSPYGGFAVGSDPISITKGDGSTAFVVELSK
jgi:hypothetical protein